MCTVSVIPKRDASGAVIGLRLVSNRDEGRDRPEAIPEQWHQLTGGVRAIWPTDPQGGGTWIAATDRGLALTLLNVNNHWGIVGEASRGMVIPAVADAGSAAEALERAAGLDLRRFSPFRLVAADALTGFAVGDLRWDGRGADLTWYESGPVAFASSGLGDGVVEPRLGVFERLVKPNPTFEAQDRFHAYGWDPLKHDRRAWAESVLMSRAGARTVSVSVIEIEGRAAALSTRLIEETAEQLALVRRHSPDGAEAGRRMSDLRKAEAAGAAHR